MTAGPPIRARRSSRRRPPGSSRRPTTADHDGIVGVGADLAPGTILHAYRHGLFPMPVGRGGRLGWWSPDPRGVLPLDGAAGEPVAAPLAPPVTRCGSTPPSTTWCGPAPTRHGPAAGSTPRSSPPTGGCTTCAGSTASRRGHRRASWRAGSTASPSAGSSRASRCSTRAPTRRRSRSSAWSSGSPAAGVRLLDVQWLTPHLASLGAVAIPRRTYLERLSEALSVPARPWWVPGSAG